MGRREDEFCAGILSDLADPIALRLCVLRHHDRSRDEDRPCVHGGVYRSKEVQAGRKREDHAVTLLYAPTPQSGRLRPSVSVQV